MKMNKISLPFKKAPFPSIMAVISLVLFIAVYLFSIMTSIEPYYFASLIFAVPFICFGIITFLTVTEKLTVVLSSTITGISIVVLGFAMLYALVFMSVKLATTVTTDIGKYERVLKLTHYPNNPLTKYFPGEIPSNTKNIVFSYNPAFLQGGENFDLKFETDSDSIKKYIDEFSHKVKWIGKSSDIEAKKNGVFSAAFNMLGYTDQLPEDFTIYLIDSKPYHPNDWNHGELSLAAISKQRNEIIFLAEDW